MNFRKTLFVLPNLFTISSFFCGFYSVTLLMGEAKSEDMFKASLAIIFAIFFDILDGGVARLTKTQSQFGIQFDSFADLLSFGIAPSMLVYKWSLTHFGNFGMAISFIFASCAALRLARFNVLAITKKPRFFVGLPTPVAAGMLSSIIIAHHSSGSYEHHGYLTILILVIILSYLMMSNVRYRAFHKHLRISSWKTVAGIVAFIMGFVFMVITLRMGGSLILVSLFSAYIMLGLMEEVIFYKRRKLQNRKALQ